MFTVLSWSSATQAAPAWYICEVFQAGATNSGRVLVQLTHSNPSPAFTKKFFSGNALIAKEQLAELLTAMAAGLRVNVNTDITEAGAPTINVMYVLAD